MTQGHVHRDEIAGLALDDLLDPLEAQPDDLCDGASGHAGGCCGADRGVAFGLGVDVALRGAPEPGGGLHKTSLANLTYGGYPSSIIDMESATTQEAQMRDHKDITNYSNLPTFKLPASSVRKLSAAECIAAAEAMEKRAQLWIDAKDRRSDLKSAQGWRRLAEARS